MALTAAQLVALKAEIDGDPALSGQPLNDDGHFAIAEAMNLPAVPQFIVWKTDMAVKDVKNAIVWTEYIAAANAAERGALDLMISNGIVNAADVNIRQGFQDIFSGPNAAGTRNNLVAIAKRDATRAEGLFANGTGSDASPGTMTFEGSINFRDIRQARAL